MRKPFAAVASALFVGFILGYLTAWRGPFLEKRDETQVGGETSTQGSTSSEIASLLPSNEHSQIENKESRTPAVAAEVQGSDRNDVDDSPEATWDELYPEAPPLAPPHVADPYFFGDPTDPEVVRTRSAALEDHIKSLREAGVPESTIQAAVMEFERAFENARQGFHDANRITTEESR